MADMNCSCTFCDYFQWSYQTEDLLTELLCHFLRYWFNVLSSIDKKLLALEDLVASDDFLMKSFIAPSSLVSMIIDLFLSMIRYFLSSSGYLASCSSR